jgi:hypothetical protein
MDQRDRPDRTDPALAYEPTESTEASEPAEPIDRIEPADPTDRIDPAEPMDKMDPLDPMLRIEPAEPISRDEQSLLPIWPFSQLGRGPQGAASRDSRSPVIGVRPGPVPLTPPARVPCGLSPWSPSPWASRSG